jgi:chromosome segregation ATPase
MDDLEKEKLNLEIELLKKPWFKNIEFWKVIIPTFAILVSLYFTFGRGILDSEKSKLEAQKEQLKLEIAQFEIKKQGISKEILSKDSVRVKLQSQINDYSSQKLLLLSDLKVLNSKLNQSTNERNYIESERNKDKTFFYLELKKQYDAKKEKLEELNRLKATIDNLSISNDTLQVELSFLQKKIKLSHSEIFELVSLKLEAKGKFYDRRIKSTESGIKSLNNRYEEEKKKIESMNTDELIRSFELNTQMFEWDEKKK